jgi:hypothetical protein
VVAMPSARTKALRTKALRTNHSAARARTPAFRAMLALASLALGIGLVATPAAATVDSHEGQAQPSSQTRFLVAGTDQASQQILVFDAAKTDWSHAQDSAALKWSWAPTAKNGFPQPVPEWRLVDEAKLRYSTKDDTHYALTTASYGFVGLIHYPSGKRKWSVNADDGVAPLDNPHSAELLPDGNVAAAASSGGWVRIYTASQGPDATHFAEYDLPGAHGVLWDPEGEVLWALGDHDLVALAVGGTPAEPTVTEVRREPLPTTYGHDLQPVYGDTDRLWVSTNTRVYQFVKSTGVFATGYPLAAKVDRASVKAVSNHPVTGQVVQTRPKAGCATTWCTDTVEFFGPDTARTRPDAQFYKARWFVADYQ